MRAVLALAVLGAVQGGRVEKEMPPFEQMIRMRVPYTVPGMDPASRRPDLVYKTVDGEALRMDVYSPSGPRPHAAVVLVHGGPIPRTGAKDMGVFVSYGELLAASGFVAIAFDHRFLSPERLPDAGADVADLVAYVRANAAALGVDPERVALWAFSGGGALLAAPLRERPGWLRAVVASYALLDMQEPAPGADSGIGTELRLEFSPLAALGADARDAPPLLVARAGLDDPWLNGGIDRFVQAALAAGASLDLVNHPTGRHGFDILDDEPRTREIVRRTLEFLREHLEP